MTRGTPFETNLNGPTWMVQLWLQWYFPKLWAPKLEFLEGVASARILVEASPTNHSTFSVSTSLEFATFGQTWSGELQY